MPEPWTLTRSRSQAVKPHSLVQASTWAAKASLSSMRSMSVRVSSAMSSAFATAGTGPIPIVRGATPPTPQETSLASGRSPYSTAFSGLVTTTTAAPSFWPEALPAVTVASGSSRPSTGRSGSCRPVVTAHRVFVLFLTGDRVLAAKVLRRLEHSAGNREVPSARGEPAGRQRVLQEQSRTGLHSPAHRGGVEGSVRHRLGAAGEHHVADAGLHLHRRVQHRLQSGA